MKTDSLEILLICDHNPGIAENTIITYLSTCRNVTITVAPHLELLRQTDQFHIIIGWVEQTTLSEENISLLIPFVRRGGALLCLGHTAELWQRHNAFQSLIGGISQYWTPDTEINVHLIGASSAMRRVEHSIMLITRMAACELPAEATPLIQVHWQYTPLIAAYYRQYGMGQIGVVAIEINEHVAQHSIWQQWLYRTILLLTGWIEDAPLRVAMLGYGAIGQEHAIAITETEGLECVLVCDRNPARLDAAQEYLPDVRTTMNLADIEQDRTIDVVIIGTPPNTHAGLAKQMLQANKHVIVEKPFTLTTAEADELISVAQEKHLVLSVYQNRRWDADFLAIQQLVNNGEIGEIFHVETFIGHFTHPCDFWHSHEPISGGVFYDWGSHYLDWILTLLPGKIHNVRALSHKRVWHDVTNADQAHLTIHFTDGAEASFIHSDVAALLKPKWYILGTKGAIVADWRTTNIQSRKWSGDLIEEPLAPSEALPIVRMVTHNNHMESHIMLPQPPKHPFHRNFASHILTGEPLAVQPLSSRRNISVMEAAVYSATHDAEVVSLTNQDNK
jgi:scyllo-inositol 2-dehydrogenase (NADP+)